MIGFIAIGLPIICSVFLSRMAGQLPRAELKALSSVARVPISKDF
jgi:hypothetical protein